METELDKAIKEIGEAVNRVEWTDRQGPADLTTQDWKDAVLEAFEKTHEALKHVSTNLWAGRDDHI